MRAQAVLAVWYNPHCMPLSEHRGGERTPEPESCAYCRAARFAGEEPAGLAYSQAQDAIYKTDCDLSAFRFQLDRLWHVAVLGDLPPDYLKARIKMILSAGDPTSLSTDILEALQERRVEAMRRGPWVEGHYRPGRRLS